MLLYHILVLDYIFSEELLVALLVIHMILI